MLKALTPLGRYERIKKISETLNELLEAYKTDTVIRRCLSNALEDVEGAIDNIERAIDRSIGMMETGEYDPRDESE